MKYFIGSAVGKFRKKKGGNVGFGRGIRWLWWRIRMDVDAVAGLAVKQCN